jgi:membrane protein implicated in regulation of membrane protease activity
MNFARTDCFPGTPWWAFAIYAFITVAVLLFAWKALRPPSRPTWSLNGGHQRRR